MSYYLHDHGTVVQRQCECCQPPLVAVIDPEDREQAERLDLAISKVYGEAKATEVVDSAAMMQRALREFANPTPPKPDEPTDRYPDTLARAFLAALNEDDRYLRDGGQAEAMRVALERVGGASGREAHLPRPDGTCSLLCKCPTPLTDAEVDTLNDLGIF